jgi:hypothetical protein
MQVLESLLGGLIFYPREPLEEVILRDRAELRHILESYGTSFKSVQRKVAWAWGSSLQSDALSKLSRSEVQETMIDEANTYQLGHHHEFFAAIKKAFEPEIRKSIRWGPSAVYMVTGIMTVRGLQERWRNQAFTSLHLGIDSVVARVLLSRGAKGEEVSGQFESSEGMICALKLRAVKLKGPFYAHKKELTLGDFAHKF